MMHLVVKLSESAYREMYDYGTDRVNFDIQKMIYKGIPLPKGHGRIIDESQVTGTFTWDNGFIECFAPTIIEADKESEI